MTFNLTPEALERRYLTDVDQVANAIVWRQDDAFGSFTNVVGYLTKAIELLRACGEPDEIRVGALYPYAPNLCAEGLEASLAEINASHGSDDEGDAWEEIQLTLDTAESALSMVGYSTDYVGGIAICDMAQLTGRQRRLFEQGEFYDYKRPSDDADADADFEDYVDFRNFSDPK